MWPFNQIEQRLETIQAKQEEHTNVLIRNTAQLEEHMRRTEVLEQRVDSFWSKALTTITIISAFLLVIDKLHSFLH